LGGERGVGVGKWKKERRKGGGGSSLQFGTCWTAACFAMEVDEMMMTMMMIMMMVYGHILQAVSLAFCDADIETS
jgi:hypothetical protein